jgi:hypothetical protein
MSTEYLSATELPVPLSQDAVIGGSCAFAGRYVYGIAMGGWDTALGPIGIDNSEVYTIPYADIAAIVHDCPALPLTSDSETVVKEWVKAHQRVLDRARETLGTIVPLRFDIIVRSQGGSSVTPEQAVESWLKSDYTQLKALMNKIEGKDEYAVQVSYDSKIIKEGLLKESPTLIQIEKEINTSSPGLAYLYQHKLEKALKSEMEKLEDAWRQEFYRIIFGHCADIAVEKAGKPDSDRLMLLNLSCLVSGENIKGLGETLEKIGEKEGLFIHFSGPWPPYSFVTGPGVAPNSDKTGVKNRNGTNP